MDNRLGVASMFSGIGGVDLGFMKSSFEVVWSNKVDSVTFKNYRYNFKNHVLMEKNISKVNPYDVLYFDVLVAGFPFQPF